MASPDEPRPAGGEAPAALIERIDALLPQTQCRRCGYEGCRPYAAALAAGEGSGDPIPHNRCPPGGTAGVAALAALLGRGMLPLDPACGTEADPGVAWIDASACIGCARCLPPCPVDAILGAQRYLHSVIEPLCNGCELCIASCPVDCISMRPRAGVSPAPSAGENRRRYEAHEGRAARRARERAALLSGRRPMAPK